MNFEFIARCYEVDENIYDPASLRTLIESRLQAAGILFEQRRFLPEMRGNYDFVVWATYGMGASREVFAIAKYQVAEKILIELPQELRRLTLVIVDGPFTAFDPYGRFTVLAVWFGEAHQSLDEHGLRCGNSGNIWATTESGFVHARRGFTF